MEGRGRRNNVVKSRRDGSTRWFYAGMGAIALAGIAFLAYKSWDAKTSSAATLALPVVTPAQAKPYVLGKDDAPVLVTEFADFECPGCGQFATVTEPDVRRLLVEQGKIRYQFVDFPLPMHPNTIPASNAAACADDQGKFWQMHDALFNGQPDWNGEATKKPKGKFKEYAQAAGMDVAAWEKCFDAQTHMTRVLGNRAMSEQQQIQQTPTFIIGNRKVIGAVGYDKFKSYVDSAAADAAAKPAVAPKDVEKRIPLDSAKKKPTPGS